MSHQVEWHGNEAERHVQSRAVRFLHRAAIVVKNRAKELLSVAGTGKKQGKQAGPVVRSLPGEPPRKQTGRLRASIAYEVDESALTARVGTNVEYGRHLELGTKRGIKPRPWLRRALAESMTRINLILAGLGER